MTVYFIQAFVYLLAAVVAVPLAQRLGLGSVLGYLVAGVVIGPLVGLVGQETETIQHFAEFGVVMMLFLVGMELDPRTLWAMRLRLLGLGGLQIMLTTLLVMGGGVLLGLTWPLALTVGLVMSVSSTAIVLQTFSEKGLGKTEGGRNAFSILLFQDLAVIPMLAVIPLLALPVLVGGGDPAGVSPEALSLVEGLPIWERTLVVIASIAAVVLGGHYLERPLFRYVANADAREVFIATALMLVIGISALMSLVGLSPALGAFLAGLVLANSEFRYELKSNIEPFKGLLLGLFFITVGAGISFDVLREEFGTILLAVLGVMLIKALVLYGLGWLFRLQGSNRWLLTLSLAQAGEFGFVLLSYSVQHQVLPEALSQMLAVVVAVSMLLTPGLFILYDRVLLPRFQARMNLGKADTIDETGTVIIAGVGRFGQLISRMLRANGFSTVVLDQQLSQVENVRRVGIKSFFGDATRPGLIRDAGADEARLFVVAIDQREAAVELVKYLKHAYPHLRVLARAFDRVHNYELTLAGADWVISETFHSALSMGGLALKELGVGPCHARRRMAAFRALEEEHSQALYEEWKDNKDNLQDGSDFTELYLKMEKAISEAMARERERCDEEGRREEGRDKEGCDEVPR